MYFIFFVFICILHISFPQRILFLIANVAAASLSAAALVYPVQRSVETIFPHQAVVPEPRKLFTPSTGGQYTIPSLELLQSHEAAVQRSVNYPAHGKSTYYYYYAPNGSPNPSCYDDELPFIDDAFVSNIPRHANALPIIYSAYQMQLAKWPNKHSSIPHIYL